MALQFPPTDTQPAPTTGTLGLDPNGLVWRATVQDVVGVSVTSWTPNSQIEAGAFQYRGFADLLNLFLMLMLLLATSITSLILLLLLILTLNGVGFLLLLVERLKWKLTN